MLPKVFFRKSLFFLSRSTKLVIVRIPHKTKRPKRIFTKCYNKYIVHLRYCWPQIANCDGPDYVVYSSITIPLPNQITNSYSV